MPLGELLYETADIAYDTVTKNYVNPKDNSIYGSTPPTGGWAVTWYMDPVAKTPVVVSGNQTAAQITQQLAAQNVTTVSDAAAPSFWDGSNFGVSNMVLVGGVAVVAAFMFFGGSGGRRR